MLSPPPPQRSHALDALRGLAILAMVLSGVIPFNQSLPAWMYHAQVPPPTHKFNPNLPGLTWVDLVFPLFLFALGAAIPLAQSRYLAKGWKPKRLILGILKRGLLLSAFAIFLQHVRPLTIDPNPGLHKWWIALLGFVILFVMYTRWPIAWPPQLRTGLTAVGWIAGVILMVSMRYQDGRGFTVDRQDIILILLANMVVFGSIAWLFTRDRPWVRLGILGLLLALHVSATEPGWIATVWSFSPAPWLFKFDYLKYLFIVIPGTFVGDRLQQWQTELGQTERAGDRWTWNRNRIAAIVGLLVLVESIVLIGLQSRWVAGTTFLCLVLCSAGYRCFDCPKHPTEKLATTLYLWGIYCLVLGLAWEPFEGGIKKDSATLSYFFITTGLSIFLLMIFTLILEWSQTSNRFNLLLDNGRNPMIAYVAFGNLVWPILSLLGWHQAIEDLHLAPWWRFLVGVGYTLIVAAIVSIFSRLKLYWRT
jgi:predicted acyltransferase